jgi:transcriptional regulator with XRE-family HTH domain
MAAPKPDTETSARSLLGDLLRAARTQGGFKVQEELAVELGMDRTGVSHTENGNRVPSARALGEWLDKCGINGLARTAIEGVAKLARATDTSGPVKIWFSGYLTAEGEARSIRIWQPLIVPGLLQTEAYARALFEKMGLSDTKIREFTEVRLKRQEILAKTIPPNITVVLWEPVLHHLIGSPEIMREQLQLLVELSKSIVIQVVPSDTAGNAGLGGAVSLVDGPGGSILLAESLIEDQVTKDADLLHLAGATFDAVRGDALPRAPSRTMITEANETWNSR